MLQIGKFNELIVKKETDFGLYLDYDQGEVLLPKKYIPEGTVIGDKLNVFIYRDSEDRIIATTLKPKAQVGEFAYLRVVDTTKYGAFLDWGLEKHLLVPYREQKNKMEKGKSYVVMVLLDKITERIVASGRINKFLDNDELAVIEGEDVNLLVYDSSELGFKVIINNQHDGLLYANEVYQELHIGDSLKGYIKRIREDHKIDVGLRRYAYEEIPQGKEKILELLEINGGFLPLHDKSEPETIKQMLQMSKKAFKKTIGSLYKEGKVELLEDGIKLAKNS